MRTTVRRTATAVALAATLALSGCASSNGVTNNPRYAAIVDGVGITEDNIDSVNKALTTALQTDPRQYRFSVLVIMVQGALADRIGADNRITITDAMRNAYIATDEVLSTLAEDSATRGLVYDIADTDLLRQKLGEAAFVAAAQKHSVVVNPRYGTWSAADLSVTGDFGSLSESLS